MPCKVQRVMTALSCESDSCRPVLVTEGSDEAWERSGGQRARSNRWHKEPPDLGLSLPRSCLPALAMPACNTGDRPYAPSQRLLGRESWGVYNPRLSLSEAKCTPCSPRVQWSGVPGEDGWDHPAEALTWFRGHLTPRAAAAARAGISISLPREGLVPTRQAVGGSCSQQSLHGVPLSGEW